MLLAINVGNTNTVLGLMEGVDVLHRWRLTTRARTTDEFGLDLLKLLGLRGVTRADIEGVMVSCVVPSTVYAIQNACIRYLDREPMVVGSGVKTGMKVRTDNPREVGSDRIVNAVAARDRFGGALVVVGFNTATTFDCVDASGAYIGGAIAPGLSISADALFTRTATLPRVPVSRPRSAIGTNTVHAMQSGLFFGYVGLVNQLARACRAELKGDVTCVATGGFSNLIGRACDEIDEVDEHLALRGLSLLWQRNVR